MKKEFNSPKNGAKKEENSLPNRATKEFKSLGEKIWEAGEWSVGHIEVPDAKFHIQRAEKRLKRKKKYASGDWGGDDVVLVRDIIQIFSEEFGGKLR